MSIHVQRSQVNMFAVHSWLVGACIAALALACEDLNGFDEASLFESYSIIHFLGAVDYSYR